jgi:hypothetical protein
MAAKTPAKRAAPSRAQFVYECPTCNEPAPLVNYIPAGRSVKRAMTRGLCSNGHLTRVRDLIRAK